MLPSAILEHVIDGIVMQLIKAVTVRDGKLFECNNKILMELTLG